jgi:hypothetical protein
MWGADSIAHNMDSSYNELVFNLVSYKEYSLPLGWYLSDASRNIIKEQADRLDNPSFKFFVKENEINMKKLKSLF